MPIFLNSSSTIASTDLTCSGEGLATFSRNICSAPTFISSFTAYSVMARLSGTCSNSSSFMICSRLATLLPLAVAAGLDCVFAFAGGAEAGCFCARAEKEKSKNIMTAICARIAAPQVVTITMAYFHQADQLKQKATSNPPCSAPSFQSLADVSATRQHGETTDA